MKRSFHALASKCEWDFNKVLNKELVPCCIWEYARESISIRYAVETVKTAIANEGIPYQPSAEHDEFNDEAQRAFGLLSEIGFEILFWTSLPFPKPWLSISETERQKWVEKIPKVTPMTFAPFRVVSDHPTAGELYKAARNTHAKKIALEKRLYEIDQNLNNPAKIADFKKDLAEASELRKQRAALPTLVVYGHGGVAFYIVQVNWSGCTDTDIKNSFCEWADANRPKGVGLSTLKGKKKETRQRVMLDRLAIMRLLHHATVNKMRERFPAAWKRYGARKAVTEKQKDSGGVDWYRERKNANLEFHRLFPFLKSELPLSWRTKAGHE